MKNLKLLKALSLADEKFVEEADPKNQKKENNNIPGRKRKLIKYGTIAACFLCVITALNLWLFLPLKANMSAINRYSDSEYFPLIEKLYAFSNKPKYNNNFSALINALASLKDATGEDPSEGISVSGADEYIEVTDNQVNGVIESDVIKRSDKYIYHIADNTLKIYEIKGQDTYAVFSYQLNDLHTDVNTSYSGNPSLYLSKDCKTLTVIVPTWGKTLGVFTIIASFDVSDPLEAVEIKNKVVFSGEYQDSRMIDGKLILFIKNYFFGTADSFGNEAAFVPQIDTGNGFESMPFQKIVTSENAMAKKCMAIYELREDTLTIDDMLGIYANITTGIYVSLDGMILSATYTVSESTGAKTISESMSELFAISRTEGFKYCGTAQINGSIKDQYSIDIKDGILRVVSTTRIDTQVWGEEVFVYNDGTSSAAYNTSASLYCIDLENMQTVASVDNFAPTGEIVRSVRFEGNKAYVCTSFQTVMIDPVFIFDISDTGNITSKDTGVIPGFSDSLINFGDYLLGIGYNGQRYAKVEIYKEGEASVDSVCTYEPEYANPYLEYKSYLIDREEQLFGFSYESYAADRNSYFVLLGFDGNSFYEIAKIQVESTNRIRALIIGDYIYIFTQDGTPPIIQAIK